MRFIQKWLSWNNKRIHAKSNTFSSWSQYVIFLECIAELHVVYLYTPDTSASAGGILGRPLTAWAYGSHVTVYLLVREETDRQMGAGRGENEGGFNQIHVNLNQITPQKWERCWHIKVSQYLNYHSHLLIKVRMLPVNHEPSHSPFAAESQRNCFSY